MKLEEIYQSVQGELTGVERNFRAIAEHERDAFPDLYKMLSHILVGGKVIRPALTLLSGRFYKYDIPRLSHMATASELLHIATLVHDDAIDKSFVRRWRETINKLWGEDRAILLGDYLFARAGEFVANTESVRAVKLFTQTLATISQGELRQSFDAFHVNLSRQDYIARIGRKTASLFAMATQTGAILSLAPEEAVAALRDYGYNLGIAFQIIDDILDFIGTEAEMGKPAGSDLGQGTLSLPSMMLLERFPEDNPVKTLFEGKRDGENIQKAIELVKSSSIIPDCYQVAGDYAASATRSLEGLPDVPSRRALTELVQYVMSRKR